MGKILITLLIVSYSTQISAIGCESFVRFGSAYGSEIKYHDYPLIERLSIGSRSYEGPYADFFYKKNFRRVKSTTTNFSVFHLQDLLKNSNLVINSSIYAGEIAEALLGNLSKYQQNSLKYIKHYKIFFFDHVVYYEIVAAHVFAFYKNSDFTDSKNLEAVSAITYDPSLHGSSDLYFCNNKHIF